MSNRDQANCPIPTPIPTNASILQQIHAHNERRTYLLCRIQSAQKVMTDLSFELAKDSVPAGVLVRDAIKGFREIEMAYLEDVRRNLQKLTDQVDGDMIMNEALAKRHKETAKEREIASALERIGSSEDIAQFIPAMYTLEEGGSWHVAKIKQVFSKPYFQHPCNLVSIAKKDEPGGEKSYARANAVAFTNGYMWDSKAGLYYAGTEFPFGPDKKRPAAMGMVKQYNVRHEVAYISETEGEVWLPAYPNQVFIRSAMQNSTQLRVRNKYGTTVEPFAIKFTDGSTWDRIYLWQQAGNMPALGQKQKE